MKARLFYILSCGLILAGIIHIVIIVLIPTLGSRDAAKLIANNLAVENFTILDGKNNLAISNSDPFMKLAVCKFDLTKNAIEIKGPKISTFWSGSVFDEGGRVIYSVNDRTAINNQLQMIIVNPIQMASLRQIQPEELETSILVESESQKGFVILRVLVRDPSWQDQAVDYLKKIECIPYAANGF